MTSPGEDERRPRLGTALLDLCCGKGELLSTWAADHGITGTGELIELFQRIGYDTSGTDASYSAGASSPS